MVMIDSAERRGQAGAGARTRPATGPSHAVQIAAIASWQPRPGRNPYDRGPDRACRSGCSA
jgi:hypothetical protein